MRALIGCALAPLHVRCAFPSDVGTGGYAQRPGHCGALHAGSFHWTSLGEALRQQYDGSWKKKHWGAAEYDEVLVGSLYYDRNLPWVIEAFFCDACKEGSEIRAKMHRVHRSFLDQFGLTPSEVPLVQYRCSEADPSWDAGLKTTGFGLRGWGGSTLKSGECFVDISEHA